MYRGSVSVSPVSYAAVVMQMSAQEDDVLLICRMGSGLDHSPLPPLRGFGTFCFLSPGEGELVHFGVFFGAFSG